MSCRIILRIKAVADKTYLKQSLQEIRDFAERTLKLRLNAKTQILPIHNGVDYLGFHTYLTETGKVVRKVRHASSKRMKRKLKKFQESYKEGELSMEEISRSLFSWLGHAEHGDTWKLRNAILSKYIFSKGKEVSQ